MINFLRQDVTLPLYVYIVGAITISLTINLNLRIKRTSVQNSTQGDRAHAASSGSGNINQAGRDNVRVTSYFQSGGVTAHTVNVGVQPRHINDELKRQLDSLLANHKTSKIDISSSLGDGEALSFANEIENYLQSKGYNVLGKNQSVWSRPIKRQEISFEDDGTVSIKIGSNIY